MALEQESAAHRHNLERKCAMLEYTTYVPFPLWLLARNGACCRVGVLLWQGRMHPGVEGDSHLPAEAGLVKGSSREEKRSPLGFLQVLADQI